MRSLVVLAFASVLATAACGPSQAEREDRAYDDAHDEIAGSTYQDQHGSDGCSSDCSGHDAGYRWAQENGIEDPSQCTGNSQAFIEVCQAYGGDLQNRTTENLGEH